MKLALQDTMDLIAQIIVYVKMKGSATPSPDVSAKPGG